MINNANGLQVIGECHDVMAGCQNNVLGTYAYLMLGFGLMNPFQWHQITENIKSCYGNGKIVLSVSKNFTL